MGNAKHASFRYSAIVSGIFLWLALASALQAQTDIFGTIDSVYIDSVGAGPGQVIAVKCNLKNDELLSGVSVPVTYDANLLSLAGIAFSGSRIEYLETKLVTPANVSLIDGHFLVTAIKVFEDPIPAGNGPIFTMFFKVSDTATIGRQGIIDTLFFPPGGPLMLVEDTSAIGIYPAFEAGKVLVRGENHPPVIAALANQQVIEGDSLVMTVSATDPDGDPITLAATSKPLGATFSDNGDGTGRFVWVPGFVGPFSADGSPFTLSFWASDGKLSTERQVAVAVINKNRQPIIEAPLEVGATAGQALSFSVKAMDPDFEDISWAVIGAPQTATFDGYNPGQFVWLTQVSDSGSLLVDFIAADPHGYADTSRVSLAVAPTTVFAFSIDTVTASPGDEVQVSISLMNQLPVASFDLLVSYDASALTLESAVKTDTRAASFETFTVTDDFGGTIGNVRIQAVADQAGDPAQVLAAGIGPVATMNFRVSSDLDLAGLTIPVRFWYLSGTSTLNTLTDSAGTLIGTAQILFTDGSVSIKEIGRINTGDINLNGLTYEISDIIYFTNFLMNPYVYSFSALQYANSDINRDGLAASVADLVSLINIVVSGGPQSRVSSYGAGESTVTVEHSFADGSLSLTYHSGVNLGGVLVTLHTGSFIGPTDVINSNDRMVLDYGRDGQETRFLIYSMSGEILPAGSGRLLTITGIQDYTIDKIDVSSADGRMLAASIKSGSPVVPDGFALYQNYPNPFNPETRIDFDLPAGSDVELLVYNLLGQKVKTLITGYFPAGAHSITWDGRDDSGSPASSGVYFYRLTAGGEEETRKMLLMK